MPPHLNDPLFTFTDNNHIWSADDWTITSDTPTNARDSYAYHPIDHTVTYEHILTERDLEHFSEKIYKIIKEHTPIDITEEEFMDLLKEGD